MSDIEILLHTEELRSINDSNLVEIDVCINIHVFAASFTDHTLYIYYYRYSHTVVSHTRLLLLFIFFTISINIHTLEKQYNLMQKWTHHRLNEHLNGTSVQ